MRTKRLILPILLSNTDEITNEKQSPSHSRCDLRVHVILSYDATVLLKFVDVDILLPGYLE
jgi:hypothetical protein